GLDPEGQRRLAERYRHHFLAREHEAPLYAGVREMLAELHARGKRLAVATGKARRGLERALDTTGLRGWFEATRCADEGFAKPHPGMLLMLLELTGVEPRRALMVGDTTHDLELAANAGVDAVAVSYGAHPEALLATRPARARCASVAELRQSLAAFAVRVLGGMVRVYVNRCPHMGTELDWQPGDFFEESGLYLVCATHGA